MPNLLERSVDWFNTRVKTAAGITATYSRKRETASLTIVPAQPERMVDLDDTSPNTTTELDWLIVAEELVVDGVTLTPTPRDRITATINGVQMVFEVLPRGQLPCWEWLDAYGLMLVVRTKRVRVDG